MASTNKKSTHPLYSTWSGIKSRCYNPNMTSYDYYGGRGITVCDRWLNSFESFLEDMGDRPAGYTLDRIDSNKGYSPDNCRWANITVQRLNSLLHKNNSIGVRGVQVSNSGKYRSRIVFKGKRYHLGVFISLQEASDTYEKKRLALISMELS